MTDKGAEQDPDDVPSRKDEEYLTTFEKVVDWFIRSDPNDVARYVGELREQNPGISSDDLAKKITRRKSFKNGLVGAATGVPGVLALPVTVPADLVASWKIQIHMALCVAYVYGHTHRTTDLKNGCVPNPSWRRSQGSA